MKITGITTEVALHMPGVGTLPPSLVVGKQAKYPSLVIEEHGTIGVKITINGQKAIIPYTQIKIIQCVES